MLTACAGDNTSSDAGNDSIADVVQAPDGQALRACITPGEPCSAHTSCAIEPICGQDRLCRPRSYQLCDDGLDCTDDICLGQGKCENTPRAGACALPVKNAAGKTVFKCFIDGDRSPDRECQSCKPDESKTAWTPATGGPCDDGDSCSKDDYCDNGTCRGTPFGDACDDKLDCTEDVCDGKGGCLQNTVMADACVINGTCYKDGDRQSAASCNFCDVKTSQAQWTKPNAVCTINAVCYRPGDRSTDGCGECDPAKSQLTWTPISGGCTIGGVCFKAGEHNPKGSCAQCDPNKSATAWTVPGNACLVANTCYAPGDQNTSKCGSCDPTKNKLDWTLAANKCEVAGTCYDPGDRNTKQGGCGVCDPAVNTTSWTVKGNDCLIANTCEKAGALKANGCGTCEPSKDRYGWSIGAGLCEVDDVCYPSGDKNFAQGGCGVCDPTKSQSSWTVPGNDCFIGNKCYKPGAVNGTGCGACDPTKDKAAFTALTNICAIGGVCHPPGTLSPSGCASCQPAVSNTNWTPDANKCEIAGTCYSLGEKHPQLCGQCDPTQNPNGWTVPGNSCLINDVCYQPGAQDAVGCSTCDPTKSKTSWTPTAGCWAIVIAALNEPHTGKLGGVAGADALCATQAASAGRPGVWKAFLADSTRSVASLIAGTDATTRKVVTTQGIQMYSSWSTIFSTCGAGTATCTWPSTATIYTFKGRVIEENEPQPTCTTSSGPNCFYDADYWHGMTKSGTAGVDTCQNWTSDATSVYGFAGEADFQQMHNGERDACSNGLAVLCVQTGP